MKAMKKGTHRHIMDSNHLSHLRLLYSYLVSTSDSDNNGEFDCIRTLTFDSDCLLSLELIQDCSPPRWLCIPPITFSWFETLELWIDHPCDEYESVNMLMSELETLQKLTLHSESSSPLQLLVQC